MLCYAPTERWLELIIIYQYLAPKGALKVWWDIKLDTMGHNQKSNKYRRALVIIKPTTSTMKIINLHKTVNINELYELISQKLNPLFHEQKQSNINFTIENKDGAIEISQPEIYDDVLFRLEANGTQLNITRSEHYVDDINSITVESILNILFEEMSGDRGLSLTLEG